MLREIAIARKSEGEYEKRWYEDERSDLFVWFDAAGHIARFQLSYDKPHAEKSVEWRRGRGFMHMRVDDGAYPNQYPGSPLLVAGPRFLKYRVIKRFREDAMEIDPEVSRFVTRKLYVFPSGGGLGRKLAVIAALAGGLLIGWRLLR